MSAFYLTVPDVTPKSLNVLGMRGSGHALHRAKKQWQERICVLIIDQAVPRDTGLFVKTTAIITVPDRRRRDAGNFGALIEKALGDALVECGVIPDDTPEYWQWTSLTFTLEPRKRATTIVVELVDTFSLTDPYEEAA